MAAFFRAFCFTVLLCLASAQGSAKPTCGNDTPMQLSAGAKHSFSTPNYPKLYDSGASCSWDFVTSKSGKLVTKCVISIPCSDSFTTSFSAGPAKNHCGVKHIREVGTDSVKVSLKPSAGSQGGFARCVAVAVSSTPDDSDNEKSSDPGNKPSAVATKRPFVSATSCPCGVKGSNRIVGGSAAGLQEYPWMLQFRERFTSGPFCGAAIIANSWALTAAHCTDGAVASNLEVVAGSYNTDMTSSTTQVRRVARIVQHPSYDSGTENNDISLLRLSSPLTYTAAVKPICLPFNYATSTFANQTGIGTGWGTTTSGGSASNKLLEVTLPILSTAQCKKYPNIAPAITSNMICTYSPGKDTCQGDSGGPLNWIDPKTNRVFVAGVVSWGDGCAKVGSPGVYTKVNNYLSWIRANTGLTYCNP